MKTSRRSMLKKISLLAMSSAIPIKVRPFYQPDKSSILPTINTDILVVGGGTAGVIAAIQAGRSGLSTVLVENGSQLGGTITTGGVAFPGLFHAWGKQVIGGIGWELVKDSVEMNDDKLPDFNIPTGKQHWKHQIRINPNLFTLLAEEKCIEAGVNIRYYETPVKINFNEVNWEVETTGKGTHMRIIANQVIDCTGNAFLTALAGFNVLREKETQPGSLMFKIGGYDLNNIDKEVVQKKYREAVINGELEKEDFRNNLLALLSSQGDNIQHIEGADSTTSETHTISNIKGRASLMKHLRFLRTLPGCEKTYLISMQPEIGVRETYRIEGEYQISLDDYVSGKIFDDAISYSFYPIDLHDKEGVIPKHLEKDTVATIPLRSMIPIKSKNFIVAGRCISSDRLANSALRVQASCMAMGQAAAAAAVLASQNKTTPGNVSINELRSLIMNHGGIVPN